MLRNIVRNRKVRVGLVCCIVIVASALLYNRHVHRTETPSEPVKIYKQTDPQTAETENSEPVPITPETKTEPDAIGERSASEHSSVPVDEAADTDPTPAPALTPAHSEGVVVPEAVATEAARFRYWREKNDVLAKRRQAHLEDDREMIRAANKMLVDFLMLQPIAARRKALETVKSQSPDFGGSEEVFSQMIADLYALGLDLEAEPPAEGLDAAMREALENMINFAPRVEENRKTWDQIMKEQRELDEISKDF